MLYSTAYSRLLDVILDYLKKICYKFSYNLLKSQDYRAQKSTEIQGWQSLAGTNFLTNFR